MLEGSCLFQSLLAEHVTDFFALDGKRLQNSQGLIGEALVEDNTAERVLMLDLDDIHGCSRALRCCELPDLEPPGLQLEVDFEPDLAVCLVHVTFGVKWRIKLNFDRFAGNVRK